MRKIESVHMDEADDTFFDSRDVASACECTGLAPAAIENEAEAESYGELYAIHEPQGKDKNSKGRELIKSEDTKKNTE